jgi:hypothetical protein
VVVVLVRAGAVVVVVGVPKGGLGLGAVWFGGVVAVGVFTTPTGLVTR